MTTMTSQERAEAIEKLRDHAIEVNLNEEGKIDPPPPDGTILFIHKGQWFALPLATSRKLILALADFRGIK